MDDPITPAPAPGPAAPTTEQPGSTARTPRPGATLRRRLGRVRRRLIGVRDLEGRLTKQGDRVTRLADKVARQSERLDRQRDLTASLGKRLAEVERATKVRSTEHDKLGFQFGAIEQRLGGVEQRLADGRLVTDPAAEAEARRLVDEIRREHEQIRARMQIVSAYEERLRRVEESVAELYTGDPRHLV